MSSASYFDEDFTDYERKILANIDKFGCHVPSVFDPEGQLPDFAYSVGFTHSVDQGEVIVFGLPSDLMAFMINETLRRCREDSLKLVDGLRISGLLDGFDVIARLIPPENIEREYFNSAMWHHVGRFGTELRDAFQLVWPSSVTGLFPWQPGCAPEVIEDQPALYERTVH